MTRKAIRPIASLFIFLVVLSAKASAQDEPAPKRQVPEMRATRINPSPPVIDGNLDDAIWSHALPNAVRNFTQRDPDDGAAPTESTMVAMAYDDEAVYFALWCYDSEPDKIVHQLVRRDRWAKSDYIVVRLDPFHDHQTGNGFEVSAAGVERDCRYYNDNWSDYDWDAVWEGNARIHPWGWAAELKIPYHCLRFTETDEHTWGVDFARYISRRDEAMRWSYTPISEGGLVTNFGHLTGLTGIAPARHLEVLPYSVARLTTEPGTDADPDGRDTFGNIGVDVKYGLTSNLTLDATINPDFGQVELDEPVLNLSTYETYFSEKRPFFLEGANLFETEFTLFYSRRIGRTPGSDVDDDSLDYFTDFPDATTILGAGKLTGRLAKRTSIAALVAVTDEETARYVTTDGYAREAVVEPQAAYSVMRIKQDLFKNSSFGLMMTSVSQDTYHPEVTGGFDWRLKTNGGMWETNGQVVFSRTDLDKTGFGFDLTLEKSTGKHFRGSIGTTIKDPYLDICRLGYTSRNDTRYVSAWTQYRTTDDIWIIRNTYNNLNFWSGWNYAGTNYELGGNWNFWIDLVGGWGMGGGIDIQGEEYSDDETRGNGDWKWIDYPTVSWWFDLETDESKMFSFVWNPGGGTDRGGYWWANYLGVEYRPRSNMELGLGANYTRNRNCLRWVENVEDSSLFARLDRDQISMEATASIMFNRNLSCQLSAQGLISGLDYDDYRFYRPHGRYSYQIDGYDHDYNYSALNSTFLLRWEYRPGSTLYLVWTRSRSDYDDTVNDFDFSRDFDRFFSAGADNLFLMKVSYWLNI